MAGEWLKFESSLPEKPETLAITIAMGWDDPDLTVGKLMRLFRWFDQHTVDGNASGVTASLLDRLIGVTGFVQAVANSGWLDVSEAGLTLQNFSRHNGATAKSRVLTAKRVANLRGKNEGTQVSNAKSVTQALAREEKRREDKNTYTRALKTETRFSEFWSSWPASERKQDKKKCLQKWQREGFDSQAEEILANVLAMKASKQWTDGYEPAPLTYLNGERWRDGVVITSRSQQDVFAGAA